MSGDGRIWVKPPTDGRLEPAKQTRKRRVGMTLLQSTSLAFAASLIFSKSVAFAGMHTATVAAPLPPKADGFRMGESRRPDGATITLDSNSLRLDGKPWTPVMGEFHYSRYPENEWREELLKMKAGGIDIVATYVFWVHHEEIEGEFDWSGHLSLRRFIEAARDVGLKAIVRCGPWCHGEVRNGGLPDWILKKGWKTRSDDTNYLAKVKILYGEIASQLQGLLWKEGGPVVGIQLDNEYSGPAEHLLSLKRIAREAGLDVPLYTRTGWPALRTPMPFGEIIPLYGVYAEGFWDREITPMPGRYWSGFHFSLLRTDSNIANELLGQRDARDSADVARYPYLTCEIGCGMMNSYHRRILVNPADVESTTLIKIDSGSTSPGYYMYHGGVNPDGKLTTLMESQATEYWNDMPVKNYDFQAPLAEYGQIRPQYHLLRRLHLFLHDWGAALAGMPPTMPDKRPTGRDDVTTLRWCARSDGQSGFVFVNNYERVSPTSTVRPFVIRSSKCFLSARLPKIRKFSIVNCARCIRMAHLRQGGPSSNSKVQLLVALSCLDADYPCPGTVRVRAQSSPTGAVTDSPHPRRITVSIVREVVTHQNSPRTWTAKGLFARKPAGSLCKGFLLYRMNRT